MDTCKLADRPCVPCQGGVPPLKGAALEALRKQLEDGWIVVNEHSLERTFTFRTFREALDFTNAVGEIAEEEAHHPEITLSWGKVSIRIWTHKIDGLTENDFFLAAKAGRAFRETTPDLES
jgi:4a-hydroxytetrahydrobiopterin dehydratase